MRLAPLAVLATAAVAILATAAHAQNPGDPDPTPAHAYYPLHVGNVWEYGPPSTTGAPQYGFRRTVVGDTVAGGRTYFVTRRENFKRIAGRWYVEVTRRILRFDTASATVRSLTSQGDVAAFNCRLDLPLFEGLCNGIPGTLYRVNPTGTFAIGTETLPVSTRYIEDDAGRRFQLAAGLGEIYTWPQNSNTPYYNARYIRIDGRVYGAPISGLPSDPLPMPPSGDPMPPESYFPLAVGNRWEGSTDNSPGPPSYVRIYVESEVTLDGTQWFVVKSQSFRQINGQWSETSSSSGLRRYDSASGRIVYRTGSGTSTPVYSCPFNGPYGAALCSAATDYPYYSKYSAVHFGVETVALYMDDGFNTRTFAAGIGPIESTAELAGTTTYTYARVGGAEYGSPLGLPEPVAGEAGAESTPALALSAAPNPARGPVALALAVPTPAPVTVEAFDALGRRVWRHAATLAAGDHTVALDTSAWPPGLYVLRATLGTDAATTRVVVAR